MLNFIRNEIAIVMNMIENLGLTKTNNNQEIVRFNKFLMLPRKKIIIGFLIPTIGIVIFLGTAKWLNIGYENQDALIGLIAVFATICIIAIVIMKIIKNTGIATNTYRARNPPPVRVSRLRREQHNHIIRNDDIPYNPNL